MEFLCLLLICCFFVIAYKLSSKTREKKGEKRAPAAKADVDAKKAKADAAKAKADAERAKADAAKAKEDAAAKAKVEKDKDRKVFIITLEDKYMMINGSGWAHTTDQEDSATRFRCHDDKSLLASGCRIRVESGRWTGHWLSSSATKGVGVYGKEKNAARWKYEHGRLWNLSFRTGKARPGGQPLTIYGKDWIFTRGDYYIVKETKLIWTRSGQCIIWKNAAKMNYDLNRRK